MAFVGGRNFMREDLAPYVGSFSQICGTKRFELLEGKAKGAHGIDLWTGSGLELTVLADRALDISQAKYKGVSLCLVSKSGIASSSYYEPEGDGWFRSFFGGLLTTCGLSNTGAACKEGGLSYGLHGRISNTPAEKVCVSEEWKGNDYEIEIKGSMREAVFYGENLLLTRRIVARMGERRFFIHDIVENQGYSAAPLFLLYHFNVGFPLLNENSELLINAAKTDFYDEAARSGAPDMSRFQKPTHEYFRQVFLHTLREDEEGNTATALVNRNIDGEELGLYLKFNRRQLPEFFTFKMMGQSDYQLGMEPSNCLPMGREFEKCRNGWRMIEARSSLSFDLEVGVLEGIDELQRFEGLVSALM